MVDRHTSDGPRRTEEGLTPNSPLRKRNWPARDAGQDEPPTTGAASSGRSGPHRFIHVIIKVTNSVVHLLTSTAHAARVLSAARIAGRPSDGLAACDSSGGNGNPLDGDLRARIQGPANLGPRQALFRDDEVDTKGRYQETTARGGRIGRRAGGRREAATTPGGTPMFRN